MPLAMVGYGKTKNDATLETGSFYSMEFGADLGVRVHPEYELTGSLRRLTVGTVDALGNVESAADMLFQVGLRIQRGRWGIF